MKKSNKSFLNVAEINTVNRQQQNKIRLNFGNACYHSEVKAVFVVTVPEEQIL
jgi:hypothetical protein